MNTKDIPQFDAAFPQKLEDETAYWPGLSKLEYAAIHIAAGLIAGYEGVQHKDIASEAVKIANSVLAACE